MEKSVTLNIRVSPDVKKSAEVVLSQLGVPIATAIDIYLKQIAFTGGIPFPLTLPKVPDSISADIMDVAQIRARLNEGMVDIESGKVLTASEAFARQREWRTNGKV